MLANVETRVTAGEQGEPFYTDDKYRAGKSLESRGTEAILNALILSNRDAAGGMLSPTTRQAFDNLWALQRTEGPMFEYACHEGNHDIRHILKINRNLEKQSDVEASRQESK